MPRDAVRSETFRDATVQHFRDFDAAKRKELAKKKQALPDGSYPIEGPTDVHAAIEAYDMSSDKQPADKEWIEKNAKQYDVPLPASWGAVHSAARLTFAAQIEPADGEPQTVMVAGVQYVVGKPIHIFPNGTWTAVDGRHVEFNAHDAKTLVDDLKTRHADVALTYDHETDRMRGSEAAGWMPVSQFEFKADGLWNMAPLWCADVYNAHIKTGHFRYLSGDALGIGSAQSGDAFHPRRLLAASLVPKPGFVRGLNGITLSANDAAMLKAWLPKESDMSKPTTFGGLSREDFAAAMKLPADVSDEDVAKAFEKFTTENVAKLKLAADDDPDAADDEDGSQEGDGSGNSKGGKRADHSAEDCENGDCKFHSAADRKANKMGAKAKGAKLGAKTKEETTDLDEKFAALGKDLADKAMEGASKVATDAAEKRMSEKFAADQRAKDVDALLLEAEKDGRVTAANREVFRETFSVSFDHGKKLLEALPKPAAGPGASLTRPNAFITGGVDGGRFNRDQMFLPNGKPDYDKQSTFLTAVMRFGAEKQLGPAEAMKAVIKGENADFEKLLEKAAGRDAKDFAEGSIGQFRASGRPDEVDLEKARYMRARILDGGAGLEKVIGQQTFASLADFQPAARTTLPMGLGYPQGLFVGSDMLPEFVGGADEAAAWPEYGFEKFGAIGEPVGIVGAPVWSSLNIIWHRVTFNKYAVGTKIDRRLRNASVTLPEGIDTTVLENLKSQVGTTKESTQATFMTTNGNYFDSSYYPTISPTWNSADSPTSYSGLPINDITAGLLKVRTAVRVAPDLLVLSYAAALAMRKNQQVIDTVRFTGTMSQPGTMVSNATLAALFAGMFNLRIEVAEAGSSSLPSGAPVSDVWGKDAFLVCTGAGKPVAPRFGMTVVAAGSPNVRAFPEELLGADGTDDIVVTDSWNVVSINNKAAYRLVGASS